MCGNSKHANKSEWFKKVGVEFVGGYMGRKSTSCGADGNVAGEGRAGGRRKDQTGIPEPVAILGD